MTIDQQFINDLNQLYTTSAPALIADYQAKQQELLTVQGQLATLQAKYDQILPLINQILAIVSP